MTATNQNKRKFTVEVLDRDGNVLRTIHCNGIKAARNQRHASLQKAIRTGGDVRIVDEHGNEPR